MSFLLETTDMDLGDTLIENIFINDYMPMANGTHVKVYLLGFKYASDRDTNMEINNQTIAKHLQISLEDVLNAWDFWEDKGIIKKIKTDSEDKYERKYNYKVEFLSLKQLYIKNNYNMLNDIGDANGFKNNQPREVTENDVIQLNKNPEINNMFNEIQHIIRRPTQITEKRRVLTWMQNFNMNPDVIVKAFEYAATKENLTKSSMFNYVEGVIRNWYDDGLTTLDQVIEDFKEKDQEYFKYDSIMRALGRYDLPTEGEREIIDTWFDEYNWNIDMIVEACKRSTGTSNPNIKYINGILKNWRKNELDTVEEVENFMLKRDKRNKKYRKIIESLGRKKSITLGEKELVDKWLDSYKFNLDIIIEACKKSVEARKPTFNYIDAILESWKEKGVEEISDIEKLDDKFEKDIEEKTVNRNKTFRRTHDHSTKFHNFEQRSDRYSAEELEDIAKRKRAEYIRKLKGD